MSEESAYRGTFSMDAGHYSQVVWKGSRKLGCGMWSGHSDGWNTQMVVCDYYPAGNMMGEFHQNVEGRVKTRSQCESEQRHGGGGRSHSRGGGGRSHSRGGKGQVVDQAAILHAHNIARCMHGAPPLTWSNSIASHAQSWADTIKGDMRHGETDFNRKHVGQNIAMGSSSDVMRGEDRKAVKQWMSEESAYRGTFSMDAGHYSQVVWKGSRQLGCGMWSGKSDGWNTQMVVCDYYPAGNLMGAFSQNVEGRVKTRSQCESEQRRVGARSGTGARGKDSTHSKESARGGGRA